MRKIFIFKTVFIFSIFAAFLTACSRAPTTETVDNSAASGAASVENVRTTGDLRPTFRADFRSEPEIIEAGTPATLAFTVRDERGAVVEDLQIVHEKPMHLLIVSKDLAEFYHVHPERSADGSYRVAHTFPSGGDYRLYADFSPKTGVPIVEPVDVRVAGADRAKIAPQADKIFEKTVDNLKVIMKPGAAVKAGQELTLDFQVFDAASGRPANDLQNYLGELAHFVIISEDLKDFVHAHPMSKGGHSDGAKIGARKIDNHGAGAHEHGAAVEKKSKEIVAAVSAHTTFPRPGLYKLWAQFQRGGRVISVPFIIDVPAGNPNEPVKAANVLEGATKITVSASGFSPASVAAEKGQPVKLAFYRAAADNCGSEIVFEKQNITRKLPVGETVAVEFTPEEAGEIAFTCGMKMYKGSVVVAD